ncbi:glycosyltransferase [Chitinophaga rhizosphaerae]|uniref:glycosyltransferase n=1 Tax=Chitinophaga rhizosphaerae TaxID=1864947 RepID=UPI000F805EC5|nr:glycosyltransferase [Chitinophaga rhizosphaerae]
MIKNKDIIIVGLQPWDIEIGSNCKNIAAVMARSNRVLYVNRALDRISAFRGKNDPKTIVRKQSIAGQAPDLRNIAPGLWTLDPRTMLESINWIPFAGLFDRFNRINNRRLASAINDAAARLGFRDPLLFIDNDFFRAFYLPEMLDGISSTIYYIRDNLTSQPYFRRHGVRLEQALMAKATLVAANSSWLASYARRHNPSSFDIGQGCDFSWMEKGNGSANPLLQDSGKPVVGYVGALIASRLDIRLVETLAAKHPEWQFVLVGPEDEAFRQSSLHAMDNVLFTGNRPAAELPSWIQSFDVCINPQLVNPMTIGNYPRKIDEYLAFGKPVVATATEAMNMFAPYVYLSRNADDYAAAIRKGLAESDTGMPAQRRAFALSHTWENSLAALERALDSVTLKTADNAR